MNARFQSIQWLLIIATAMMLSITYFGGDDGPLDTPSPLAGTRPNLNITLKDDTGRNVDLSSFSGKVVMFNFFGTWCGPCIAEMPAIVKLQAAHPDDLAVVGLLVRDPHGVPLPTFRSTLGLNYVLLDANESEDAERALGTPPALPYTVILNRNGQVVTTLLGTTSLDTFERAIASSIMSRQ